MSANESRKTCLPATAYMVLFFLIGVAVGWTGAVPEDPEGWRVLVITCGAMCVTVVLEFVDWYLDAGTR